MLTVHKLYFYLQDSKGNSQELRMLQRKNVELSSLVRKLDEKNQQLATRNAELVSFNTSQNMTCHV